MPFVIGLSVMLQIACAIHVIRTNRPLYWIWLLLIGSYIVVTIYALTQILPDLRHSRTARRAVRGAVRAIDPTRDRRRIEQQLRITDTLHNRLQLAGECLNLGDFEYAEELYRGALKGLYATDPAILLGLARAQAGRNDFTGCRSTLETLIQSNPDYRSPDGHLLYARSLDALGETAAALTEYEALALGFPGEEGRVRFAELLIREGQIARAREVLDNVIDRTRHAPRYYRKKEAQWVTRARELLKTIAERPEGG